jgi:hypothetical protein
MGAGDDMSEWDHAVRTESAERRRQRRNLETPFASRPRVFERAFAEGRQTEIKIDLGLQDRIGGRETKSTRLEKRRLACGRLAEAGVRNGTQQGELATIASTVGDDADESVKGEAGLSKPQQSASAQRCSRDRIDSVEF